QYEQFLATKENSAVPDAVAPRPNPPSADVVRAERDLAKANLRMAQANLNRNADLYKQKLLGSDQLQMAKAEVVRAEAALRSIGANAPLEAKNPFVEEAIQAQQQKLTLLQKPVVPSVNPNRPLSNPFKRERLRQLLTEEIRVAEDEV